MIPVPVYMDLMRIFQKAEDWDSVALTECWIQRVWGLFVLDRQEVDPSQVHLTLMVKSP